MTPDPRTNAHKQAAYAAQWIATSCRMNPALTRGRPHRVPSGVPTFVRPRINGWTSIRRETVSAIPTRAVLTAVAAAAGSAPFLLRFLLRGHLLVEGMSLFRLCWGLHLFPVLFLPLTRGWGG